MLKSTRASLSQRVPKGNPLNSVMQAPPAVVVTKGKYVAALQCPKRLYFLESAALDRHRALMLRRTGARHVFGDDTAKGNDGAALPAAVAAHELDAPELPPGLERGHFTDSLKLLPAAVGHDVSEPLAIPDIYAAIQAQPPPAVLVRLVEQQRVTNWARLWHANWCAARLGVQPVVVRADEEGAEARVEEAIAKWRADGGKAPVAFHNAVVGYTLELPGGGGSVRVRTRIDLLHFVPPGKAGIVPRTPPAGPEGKWEAVEVGSFIEARKEHTDKLAVVADYTRLVLRKALGISLVSGLQVAHISRSHLRKAYSLRSLTAGTLADALIQAMRISPVSPSIDETAEHVAKVAAQLQTFRTTGAPQDWSLHFNDMDKLSAGQRESLLSQKSLCSSACGKCHFTARCVPSRGHFPNSIFTVPVLPYGTKAEYWNDGVRSAKQLPEPHTPTQVKYLEALKRGEPTVDVAALAKFISGLRYPAVILDFEATQYAVPPHHGLSAYDHLPFQFSAHVFYKDILTEEPEHFAYLHLGDGTDVREDPRAEVSRRLSAMFESVESKAESLGIAAVAPANTTGAAAKKPLRIGCVLAHNASFESKTIRRLELFSANQNEQHYNARYASSALPWLDSIALGRAVTVAEAGGSKSIKNLLPAFAPTSAAGSYTGLKIKDGAEASAVYALLSLGWLDHSDAAYVKQVREDLERYCALDTMAVAELIRGAVARVRAAGYVCDMPKPVYIADLDTQAAPSVPKGNVATADRTRKTAKPEGSAAKKAAGGKPPTKKKAKASADVKQTPAKATSPKRAALASTKTPKKATVKPRRAIRS